MFSAAVIHPHGQVYYSQDSEPQYQHIERGEHEITGGLGQNGAGGPGGD